MSGEVLGWDVGGAHLKLARLGGDGALEAVRIVPCPLWKGLDELDRALDALGADAPADAVSAVTMTGELVDLWPDRATGVAALSDRLSQRLGPQTRFYGGADGFLTAGEAAKRWACVASANWRATAEALALGGGDGLLIDIGSTTADLILFSGGDVTALGSTDASRMAAEELVYLGVARTPVMAVAPRLPFGGAWITPMAEHFATTADVFRLTGDLPDDADLHPAADGGEKTREASARRLLRMVGADLDAETGRLVEPLARWIAEAVLRRLCDAASCVQSRRGSPVTPTIYGAGVGQFLTARLARRLGLLYRDVGELWTDDARLAGAAADCAPAVAVARLYAAALSA
ncbi:hydantoinase/oxoprolinase family protein [Chenggangzhangella methanolivorans]|uniref:S-layer protein n=1 Tax=Chenggangzhangella methanolivorans TaxID=1437009 RepID=A0A9E6RAT7_9HYPH|nr:hydantoinase/oxoprolinase family protein [Chenggangzhangella methanolivorans]QZN99933.1 S-layer protein [Chenggangzhangella methanolivorans]